MTTDHHEPATTDERVHRLVAGILDIATDLEDDRPERLPLSPRKLAAGLRTLAQPGLDPAMNDGWTMRQLTVGMRDLERFLAELGLETGSIGDGPYPPWEVAIGEIGRLRAGVKALLHDVTVILHAAEAPSHVLETRLRALLGEGAAEKGQTQELAPEADRLRAGIRRVLDEADRWGAPAYARDLDPGLAALHDLATGLRALIADAVEESR